MTHKPLIRLCYQAAYWCNAEPRTNCLKKVKWMPCTRENLLASPSFSAMGVYFALELFSALDIPVGVVGAWWGGTPIEAWIPASGLASVPETAELAGIVVCGTSKFPKEGGFGGYEKAQNQPRVLWNSMLAPWVPYAMRGFIWYQGESNVDGARLVVAADGVDAPKKLRYLHSRPWSGAIYNEVNLPMGAFLLD